VVLGFYAADGTVLGADRKLIDASFQKILDPAGSLAVSFDRIYAPDNVEIARVEAWADCDVP
jgi:hypothetical protein